MTALAELISLFGSEAIQNVAKRYDRLIVDKFYIVIMD